jgi:hypothetical protein
MSDNVVKTVSDKTGQYSIEVICKEIRVVFTGDCYTINLEADELQYLKVALKSLNNKRTSEKLSYLKKVGEKTRSSRDLICYSLIDE